MGVILKGSGVSGNRENLPAKVPSADGEFTYGGNSTGKVSTVIMAGGTSGDDRSYLPNISVPFDNQVPQDTDSNKSYPSIVLGYCTGNRDGNPAGGPGENSDPPVPNCGTPDDSAA